MKKIIIFGTGDIAQIAKYYLDTDSNYEPVAFTVDKEFLKSDSYEDLPLIAFDELESKYSPQQHKMFVALSYSRMNSIREKKYIESKKRGYQLISYISSKCSYLSPYDCGDNCFIFEDNTIQPFVTIGNNVTIWSGNHIGHHSEIHDHNFISSHVVISGHCVIQSNCFLGVNSTLAHKVNVAKNTLVGAGAVITSDTEEKGVYVAPRSIKINKSSDQIRL